MGWLAALKVYREPRLLAVLLMGFSSGLPLALTGSTLAIRLADAGIALAAIGLFSLVGTAYSLKFLWAPVIDRVPLPWLTNRFGRRRGWALLTQCLLIISILALGSLDPAESTWTVAVLAVAVAFASASQDIVVDAYRVELLSEGEQGAGAAATQLGYRIGMIVSGAGALALAQAVSWHLAYLVMAGSMLVGVLTVLATPEPRSFREERGGRSAGDWLYRTVVEPFADFLSRPAWAWLLLFIVLYKLGDAYAGVMSGVFYLALGFTKAEIAGVTKLFGVVATMLGVAFGGVAVFRLGLVRALLVCGLLQNVSTLLYAWQVQFGHDLTILMVTIGAENVTTGMGSAVFVAFLSSLCSPAFTATQYALFSSLAAVPRSVISSTSGFMAQALGWERFFLVSAAAGLPALLLLTVIARHASSQRGAAAVG